MRVCIIKNAEAEKISAVYRIINALIADGHECMILSRNRNANCNSIIRKRLYIKNCNVDVYEISIKSEIGAGMKNMLNLGRYIKTVKRWLISNNDLYDVVHAFDLDAGLATLQASKRTSISYVYHIADFYVDSRGGIPKLLINYVKNLEFKVINNAETTIICTEQRKEQIKGSKPKNLVVIHNSPAVDSQAVIEENKESPLKLTYVGGLSENRFIKEIIDIAKDNDILQLTLAGTGPLKDFVENSSNVYKNINYLGQVLYEDAIEIYRDCDIIFAIYNPEIKNHRYSAPNKFYEAMMLGKAIIVAKDTGVDKLVEKDRIGIIADYSKESVENKLNSLINDRQYLYDLKINSRKSYKKYSYKEMSERIQHIYRNL